MNGGSPQHWNRLDNAAKIFPATTSRQDTKVFRFSCQLREKVVPGVLQEALDRTVKQFPVFCSVMKRGLFWYYLERSSLQPLVEQEWLPPCAPLYNPNRRELLFRVSYYQCRISFEVYHALTDGTGALQFLRTLVWQYLVLRHGDQLGELPAAAFDSSEAQREEDSFSKYYDTHRKKGRSPAAPTAYHVKGKPLPEGRIQVIEGIMPAGPVLAVAREHGATLTALLAGALILSIGREMETARRNRPVVLDIPVNLRKHFRSATARNFFGVVRVGHRFDREGDLWEIAGEVDRQLKEELTVERLGRRMSALTALEHNLLTRAVPLFVKDVTLKFFYRMAERETSSSFSNLGRIEMPDSLRPYIRRFDVFVSTAGIQACACTYADELTISFTSAFASTDICKNFFRLLAGLEIPIEIVSNQIPGEEGKDAIL